MINVANHGNISLFDAGMMGLESFCGIFLIQGKKNVIIDTGTKEFAPVFADYLQHNDIFPDYIVITHNHHDHIGGISHLVKTFKDHGEITIISSELGKERLLDPNTINQVYTEDIFDPVENVTVFEDGQILDLGDIKLQIIYTPGHSDDSISVYEQVSRTIFPGDLPGDWLWDKTYISPHITPDFSERKYFQSNDKILSLDFDTAALPHFGFFKGRNAYEVFKQQKQRYLQWKEILVLAWNKNRSEKDLISHLKTFFCNSPVEQHEYFGMIMEQVAKWTVMGYKNSGIID